MKNIKVIIADTQRFDVEEEQILPGIAPAYVQKYKKQKIESNARQELISGYLLSQYLGVTKDEQLYFNKHKKPFLVSGTPFFNLSHSGNLVVLAIADCDIGIDVEKVRKCHEATVKKVFSTKRKEEVLSLEGQARDECFTKMWTEYEAMLKLRGTGFAEDWDREKMPVENCCLQTTRVDDYLITCAAFEEIVNMEIIEL